MGSHEVAGKRYVFNKNREITSIGTIFTSTSHTKQLNPLSNSSASRVVIHSRICLLVKGRWGHLKATKALMDARQAQEEGLSESRLFNL